MNTPTTHTASTIGQATSLTILLEPNDSSILTDLCGKFNEHLKHLETRYGVEIHSRGNRFKLYGTSLHINRCADILKKMHQHCLMAGSNNNDGRLEALNLETIHLFIQEEHGRHHQENQNSMSETKYPSTPLTASDGTSDSTSDSSTDTHNKQSTQQSHSDKKHETVVVQTPRKSIESRGLNQARYLKDIEKNDINFGIGPAGTGKTYLAVACAVAALKQEQVGRIVLVRPAVEAGEKLGFLPGDLNEKVNPYLRPLYDALYEMLGFEVVDKMLEKKIIEIAPLAYMRGRTLNNAFIILDESQNTTREQMKMFLTRIGFGAKAVITGDITQIDLPKGSESGLIHATKVLENIKEIGFAHFTSKDVVRHKLVQKIVEAYDNHDHNSTIEAVPKRHEKH